LYVDVIHTPATANLLFCRDAKIDLRRTNLCGWRSTKLLPTEYKNWSSSQLIDIHTTDTMGKENSALCQ